MKEQKQNTVRVSAGILKQLIVHSKRELPNEACGYLAGKEGEIVRYFPMTNIDQSPDHFSFSPEEQFETVLRIREEQLEIVGNYHSHPKTPARPSQEDIRLAYDPSIYYLIVSLLGNPQVKAFQIQEGEVTPIELVVF